MQDPHGVDGCHRVGELSHDPGGVAGRKPTLGGDVFEGVPFVSVEVVGMDAKALQAEVLRLQKRIAVLSAFLRLLFVLLRVSGFSLKNTRLPDGLRKQRLLRAIVVPWIRDGRSVHTAENLTRAVDASLVRLKTDYIDLFQLHWPDRAANFFGQLGFKPARNEQAFSIEETLYALDNIVRSGKIRYVGLSNETPWGMMEFLRIAGAQGLPRIASIQNPYNLLNRSFEVGGAEIAHRERLSLLAYSPLGSGTLSGKYLEDRVPADARLTFFGRHDRYSNAAARAATRRYVEIASAAAIDPAHMALAFVASKPFVSSVIIGASSIAQLDHNLKASGLKLPRELLKAIDAVHEEISNPCP